MVNTSSQKVPVYTPTMLNTYQRCPQQYFLKYVERQRRPEEAPSPDLMCGTAAHSAIAVYMEHFRRHRAFPAHPRQQVEALLPIDPYPDHAAWAGDVEKVLGWVNWVLTDFDGTAEVAAVERNLDWEFPGRGDTPRFRLRAMVDLVTLHPDDTVEHTDWKTGKGYRLDRLQTLVSRIVVGQAFPNRRVLSTTAFLAQGASRTQELTYDEVRAGWEEIKGLAHALAAEEEWLPISNALCPWCPFHGKGCPLYPTAAAPDAMTDWLEGAA